MPGENEYNPETETVISISLLEEMRLKLDNLAFQNERLVRTKEQQDKLILTMTEQLTDREWRLVLSQSFGSLMVKAYTALQSYNVDYRKLKTYKGWKGIGWFEGSNNQRYREAQTRFITEIGHDIDAAIKRRTNLKEVDLSK